jgi:photosystem II stability/assembly factor-like uncharacterized protein
LEIMVVSTQEETRLYVGLHDGLTTLTSSDGGLNWKVVSTAPVDHAVARIVASPSDPLRAYMVAYESGVFRTDDAGTSWVRLNTYPRVHAHSVDIHPEDPNLIFIGSEPAAVFMSSNGGQTWSECDGFSSVPGAKDWSFHWEGRSAHVRDIRVAPHDSDWIYAGIEVGGVLRSRDGGIHWEELTGIDPDVHTIDLSPLYSGVVYAGTANGPFRSRDAGDTWESISFGIAQPYTLPITASPNDPEHVLVGVASSSRRKNGEAYISITGGREWTRLDPLCSEEDMTVAFAWDPVSSERVYAVTEMGKLLISQDCGFSWVVSGMHLPRVAVGAFAVTVIR